MRHHKKHGMKLGTDASHTKAMKRSLVCALFENDRIKTTLPKAKAIRKDVDRVVTLAKKGTIHARRLAIAQLNDKELVRETFEKAAQGMWKDRNGGYTRILKLGKRKGDNAEVAIIELVQEAVRPSTQKAEKVEKVEKAKSSQKKADTKAKAASKKQDKAEAKEASSKEEVKEEKKPSKSAEKPEEKADKEPKKEEAPESAPEQKKEDESSKSDSEKDSK